MITNLIDANGGNTWIPLLSNNGFNRCQTMGSNKVTVVAQLVAKMGLILTDKHDQHIRCSALALRREEHRKRREVRALAAKCNVYSALYDFPRHYMINKQHNLLNCKPMASLRGRARIQDPGLKEQIR
jgi:hypothetical protein